MPAKKKSLQELVADGSFLARRHADRLLEEPLKRKDLAALQETYAGESDKLVRAAIALAFERAVLHKTTATLPLTHAEWWYASVGSIDADRMALRRRGGKIEWAAYDKLERRWTHWDRRHGTFWRVRRGVVHNLDRLKLVWLLTGRRLKRVPDAEVILAGLGEELERLIAEREPIPDPPGWELLARP